jgi:hypothetical protein
MLWYEVIHPSGRLSHQSARMLTYMCWNFRTQIDGIFARADADGNAEIDFEEFMVCPASASLLTHRPRETVQCSVLEQT